MNDLTTHGKWLARAKRGEFLGRLESWGLDVYETSPQEWKDALRQERRHDGETH